MCGEKRVTMGWIAAAEKDGTPLPVVGGVVPRPAARCRPGPPARLVAPEP